MDASAYYDGHPISEEQVLAALSHRGLLPGRVTAETLFELDQDHYGGLAAVETLARLADIARGSRVLDLGAGLGGPARFLARRLSATVTGVELNRSRAAGAVRLTRLVGLSSLVRIVRADVTRLPFRTGTFDACVSEETLLHVDDKRAALEECRRVLRPGGRIAFTDWIAHPRLSSVERRRLSEWMAATTVQRLDGYRTLLGRAGFSGIDAQDLSAEWRQILRGRQSMHRSLRASTIARLGQARYDEYDQLHAFFVGLVDAGKLGGGRFSATR